MILDIVLVVLLGVAGWLGFRKSAFRFVLPMVEWIIGLYGLMKLTPLMLSGIHRLLNPEPRLAFLFTFLVLALGIYSLLHRINRHAARYFEATGRDLTGNVVKGITAICLVVLVASWIVSGLERYDLLPAETRSRSHAYPMLRTVAKGTGLVTHEFAQTFDAFSRTIGTSFPSPTAPPPEE